MAIVWSVHMALIILTWKFDSRPTSRGSLTPGKLEPVSLIHEPQHSTKDLTSPVSWLTGRTDGKRNFSWFKRKVFGLLLFFFLVSPPSHRNHNIWNVKEKRSLLNLPTTFLWLLMSDCFFFFTSLHLCCCLVMSCPIILPQCDGLHRPHVQYCPQVSMFVPSPLLHLCSDKNHHHFLVFFMVLLLGPGVCLTLLSLCVLILFHCVAFELTHSLDILWFVLFTSINHHIKPKRPK